MRGDCIGFHFNLLKLETDRAEYIILSDPPLFEVSELYLSDIARALHALDQAERDPTPDESQLDLRYNWLTLLGNRLAIERGLHTEGLTILAFVASARLNLPLKETKARSEGSIRKRCCGMNGTIPVSSSGIPECLAA